MLASRYAEIKKYLIHELEPKLPHSTLSNFRAEAKKYKINKKGLLTRDGKPVLKKKRSSQNLEAVSYFRS